MERITLQPRVRELVFRGEETGPYFDALSYRGTTNQERSLGSLIIVSHIKPSDDDLSYLISLIFSLAKREYYSEESIQKQNPKSAFSRTLSKLNETIEEFSKNKSPGLDIGLAVIAGENIFISRLGKFKITLARQGQIIDILNNVNLFNKDIEGEKQFSNIISGKLQPGDRLFAYFPFRSITSREKQLNNVFVEAEQDVFAEKLAQLSANVKTFSCCGAHVQMTEVKEIPIRVTAFSASRRATAATAIPVVAQAPNQNPPSELLSPSPAQSTPPPSASDGKMDQPIPQKSDKDKGDDLQSEPQTDRYTIPAGFSAGRRSNIFTPIAGYISKLGRLEHLHPRARSKAFFLISGLVILPFLIFISVRSFGDSAPLRNALNAARENYRLAQSSLSQNNAKEARALVHQALASLSSVTNNKKADQLQSQMKQTLSALDKDSGKRPELFLDLGARLNGRSAKIIAVTGAGLITADDGNTLLAIGENSANELAKLDLTLTYLFDAGEAFTAYDGSSNFWSFNLKALKPSSYILKEPTPAADATVYENNLYVLSGNSIYKYADAITGGTTRTLWGSDSASGELISVTADGNLYALATDGKLVTYFKGQKKSAVDLQIVPAAGSRIFTFKDHSFLYLADKAAAKVYVFDKTTGELKTSYDLSGVYGEHAEPANNIISISVSPDGSVWALSSDNKIWVVK